MIDLHVHSTCSDGSLRPEDLPAVAREAGLAGIALTDHDNTAGIEAFLVACEDAQVFGVPGVEISVDTADGGMHLLGYFIDLDNAPLQGALDQVVNGRTIRNHKILEKLNSLGMSIAWESVAAKSGSDVVGRPHFAQALMEAGYVGTTKEAFNRYLARGKPAYVDRYRLLPREGIELIAGAGGVAVLAHPCTLKMRDEQLRAMVRELKECGLGGLEVYYSEHRDDQVGQYRRIAEEFDLVKTGGSDFHGSLNPDIKLGRGFGNLEVPDESLAALCRVAGVNYP